MTNKCKLVVSVIILICCNYCLAAEGEFDVEPSTVLKTLDKGHPCLMLNPAEHFFRARKRLVVHPDPPCWMIPDDYNPHGKRART